MEETICAFCGQTATDWCPGCGLLLCDGHGDSHDPSFDRTCRQDGEDVTPVMWCGTFVRGGLT